MKKRITFLILLLFGFMIQWQSVSAQEATYDAEDMATLKQFFMDHPGLLKLWGYNSIPNDEMPDDTKVDDPLWEAKEGGWQDKCKMGWDMNPETKIKTLVRFAIFSSDSSLDKLTLKGFKNLNSLIISGIKNLNELILEDLPALQALNMGQLKDSYLKSLTCTNLSALQTLVVKDSRLESLTCTDLPVLTMIDAEDTPLKEFKHSNLSALKELFLKSTKIESLDLSYMSELMTLETYIGKNLATLILPENNSKLKRIYAGYHPNLTELKNLEKQSNLTFLYVVRTNIYSLDAQEIVNLELCE